MTDQIAAREDAGHGHDGP